MKTRYFPLRLALAAGLVALASAPLLPAAEPAVSPSADTASPSASAPTVKAKTPKVKRGGDTKIQADHGEYDFVGRTVVYTGHVHIDNPDMRLYCAKITSYSPAGSGHPDRIVAECNTVETNVVIDMLDDQGETNHVTGHLAVYEYHIVNGATNETVTVTGDPHISSPKMFGTADRLQWNRTTGHMSADNPNFTSREELDQMMAHTNTPAGNPPTQ